MSEKSSIDLLEAAIGRADREYDELVDTWRAIDTKAQASSAIAGIFLAAAFAFVRNSNLKIDGLERGLLVLLVVALVLAICMALWCMFVRTLRTPITGTAAMRMVDDIVAHVRRAPVAQSNPDDSMETLLAGFLRDSLEPTLVAIGDARDGLRVKAVVLQLSQQLLVGAAILIMVLTIVATTGHTNS